MEITMTTHDSDVQVIYNGDLFILHFNYDPYNKSIPNAIKKVENWDWNTRLEKKWTVPRTSLNSLTFHLKEFTKWKTKEQMKADTEALSEKEEALEEVLSRMPKEIETPYMKIEPYDFQKVAVAWAITPKGKRGQVYGGLLGDLMGLGKTIEALAISGYLKKENKIKNCLIICPATLKMQWSQEIEKFTYEKSIIIEGDKKKREKKFENIEKDKPFYTIVNYELLYQKDIVDKEAVGKKPKEGKQKMKNVYGDYNVLPHLWEDKYDMVVIDEAHRMKNPDTETAIAIRKIQPNFRLLMTGTPIEKDLQNIFQLMDYISPNIFAHKDYSFEERKRIFEERFLIIGRNPFMKWNYEPMVVGVKNVGILKSLVSPYMLRRTTEDISDELPEMKENMIIVDWETEQKRLYDKLREELSLKLEERGKAKNQEEAEKAKNQANGILTYLLEVCNTPELLLRSDSHLAKQLVGKKKKFPKTNKLKLALETAEQIMTDTEQKIVIFSKFETMTQVLKEEFELLSQKLAKDKGEKKGTKDFEIVMYTGKTPKGCPLKASLEKKGEDTEGLTCESCSLFNKCETRTKSAWLFQNDPKTRIILATDAANYGVNLQTGQYLFNYDLPYSYAVYAQRCGRIQRLGSKHEKVHIYNFGVRGAVDESLYHKLMEQKELIGLVVEKTELEEDAVIKATSAMASQLINELTKK